MKPLVLGDDAVRTLRMGTAMEVTVPERPLFDVGDRVYIAEAHHEEIGSDGGYSYLLYRADLGMELATDVWQPAEALDEADARITVAVTHVFQERTRAGWGVRVEPGPWAADWRAEVPDVATVKAHHAENGGYWWRWTPGSSEPPSWWCLEVRRHQRPGEPLDRMHYPCIYAVGDAFNPFCDPSEYAAEVTRGELLLCPATRSGGTLTWREVRE